jgi:hypothetical protein
MDPEQGKGPELTQQARGKGARRPYRPQAQADQSEGGRSAQAAKTPQCLLRAGLKAMDRLVPREAMAYSSAVGSGGVRSNAAW